MELRQLKLFSKNIEKQYQFYKNTLGFEVKFIEEHKIQIHSGNTKLIFEEQKESNFIYHFAFLIPNGKIEDAIPFLEEKGINLLQKNNEKIIYFGTKESYVGRAIYFLDADDNIAEFIERPSLGHVGKESFSLHQIIKINEIGLSVEDPLLFSRQLISKFKIEMIDPNHTSEVFCWIGDYDGVFIVVKNGRYWLPTQFEAFSNDLSVVFESNGKQYEMEFSKGKVMG